MPTKTDATDKVGAEYRIPRKLKVDIGVYSKQKGVAASRVVEDFLREGLANRKAKAAIATASESN